MSFSKKQQQGQVLVIILLVSVVGLTIGLSIAGRSLQTVEQTAQTEEANRAFSAAEAGVEEALLDLSAGTPIPAVPPSSLEGGGEIADVDINPDYGLETDLKKDEVVQVSLDGASGSVTVRWTYPAALVMSQIYDSGGYKLKKYAYNSQTRSNGFNLGSSVGGGEYEESIALESGAKVLRIRSMYSDTELTVSGSLPQQGTEIVSTGQSGESQRTVRAVRSLPALPAIFDYVLFSGGSISK